MKSKRFASLLLTGKVATLPVLVGQARADVTPSYSDMVSSTLRVIEIPFSTAVRLQSIAADAGGPYGSYAANICTNVSLPSTTSVVVTGLKPGDNVMLAAASNKNDPLHTALDSRLTIGSRNLSILGTANVGGGYYGAGNPTGNVVFNISTSSLTNLATSGSVYVQAAVIPAGASSSAGWKFSELDEITVGTCAASSYSTY